MTAARCPPILPKPSDRARSSATHWRAGSPFLLNYKKSGDSLDTPEGASRVGGANGGKGEVEEAAAAASLTGGGAPPAPARTSPLPPGRVCRTKRLAGSRATASRAARGPLIRGRPHDERSPSKEGDAGRAARGCGNCRGCCGEGGALLRSTIRARVALRWCRAAPSPRAVHLVARSRLRLRRV
jgi:hypothetical protein